MIRYLLCFLFLTNSGFCQTLFEGQVSDNLGPGVSGISVLLLKGEKKVVAGWDKTDQNGRFLIKYTGDVDSLFIAIKAVGYEEIHIPVIKSNFKYDIVLTKTSKNLREIIVRPPVIKKKDTLSYDVDFFTQIGDRTLADVMKRIPGLNIDLSGKITYFGQPIEKYYIEGLDLLGGQYGLANNNLAADKVARVEILENHQSIRMLDSLRFSERTSINIRLKNKYTATMPARIGVGGTPLLGLVEIIPMIFSPKSQFITGLKASNTGEDITTDLDDHTNVFKPVYASRMVDIARVSIPDLPSERWWFNKTAYGAINSLNKLKNDVELRLQASYLLDQINLFEESKTTYHIPNDPVTFIEFNETRHKVRSFKLGAELSENTKRKYFSNKLKFEVDHSSGWGKIMRDSVHVNQVTRMPLLSVENNFKYLLRVGSQLFQISSEVSFKNSPQYLETTPDFFGFEPSNALTRQEVETTKFAGNINISIYRNLAGFGYIVNSGLFVQKHEMWSDLFFNRELLSDEYRNALKLSSKKIYLDQKFERKWNNFIVKFSLPLSYMTITREDAIHSKANSIQRVPFEPEISLHHVSGKNWSFSTQADRKRSFGLIEDINYGYLLTNYRNMAIKDSPVPENIQQKASITVKYNDPFTYFSSWASVVFYNQKRNLVYNYFINEDGSKILTVNQDWNKLNSKGLLAGLKYTLPAYNASFGFTGGWNSTLQRIMFNSNLVNQNSHTLHGIFTWRIKLGNKVSVNAENSLNQTKNRVGGLGESSVTNQKHNFSLLGGISKEHSLKIQGEYYKFSASSIITHTTFWNFSYTFSRNRKEIDLSWRNIFNNKKFDNSTLTDFTERNQSLHLRPSQFLITFRWTIGTK